MDSHLQSVLNSIKEDGVLVIDAEGFAIATKGVADIKDAAPSSLLADKCQELVDFLGDAKQPVITIETDD